MNGASGWLRGHGPGPDSDGVVTIETFQPRHPTCTHHISGQTSSCIFSDTDQHLFKEPAYQQIRRYSLYSNEQNFNDQEQKGSTIILDVQ